jgi:adenylate kinase
MIYDIPVMVQWNSRPFSMLLLGPTGSGKTPLGDAAARSGLWGRRCLHFDFGAHLRTAGEGGLREAGLTKRDYDVIRSVLQTGDLLKDSDFPIARKLLIWFLQNRKADNTVLLLLNGLPRHRGQAEAMDTLVEIGCLLELRASPGVILRRIQTDAGGDRAGRRDDSLEEIANKLAIYRRRTKPLLDYYRGRGRFYLSIDVKEDMGAADMLSRLESQNPVIPWGEKTSLPAEMGGRTGAKKKRG